MNLNGCQVSKYYLRMLPSLPQHFKLNNLFRILNFCLYFHEFLDFQWTSYGTILTRNVYIPTRTWVKYWIFTIYCGWMLIIYVFPWFNIILLRNFFTALFQYCLNYKRMYKKYCKFSFRNSGVEVQPKFVSIKINYVVYIHFNMYLYSCNVQTVYAFLKTLSIGLSNIFHNEK